MFLWEAEWVHPWGQEMELASEDWMVCVMADLLARPWVTQLVSLLAKLWDCELGWGMENLLDKLLASQWVQG